MAPRLRRTVRSMTCSDNYIFYYRSDIPPKNVGRGGKICNKIGRSGRGLAKNGRFYTDFLSPAHFFLSDSMVEILIIIRVYRFDLRS